MTLRERLTASVTDIRTRGQRLVQLNLELLTSELKAKGRKFGAAIALFAAAGLLCALRDRVCPRDHRRPAGPRAAALGRHAHRDRGAVRAGRDPGPRGPRPVAQDRRSAAHGRGSRRGQGHGRPRQGERPRDRRRRARADAPAAGRADGRRAGAGVRGGVGGRAGVDGRGGVTGPRRTPRRHPIRERRTTSEIRQSM